MFGFTGEPTDANGLVQLRARYYNPALGVFPSLDPFEGSVNRVLSVNRYTYVQDNVTNRVDPMGLDGEEGILQAAIDECGGDPECVAAILAALGLMWLWTRLTTKVKVDTYPGGPKFPCSRDPFYGLRSYAPFGFYPQQPFAGDPLGDMLCHLEQYGGEEYAALFRTLSSRGLQFKMEGLVTGFGQHIPGFDYYSGPSGLIYVPQPTGEFGLFQGGTRADRLASFVEEIVHAAQFQHLVPGIACESSTVFEGELDAKAKKLLWILHSGISAGDFVYTRSKELAVGLSGLADYIHNQYDFADELPLFRAFEQGVLKTGYAVCPGPVEVPWKSRALGNQTTKVAFIKGGAKLIGVQCLNLPSITGSNILVA